MMIRRLIYQLINQLRVLCYCDCLLYIDFFLYIPKVLLLLNEVVLTLLIICHLEQTLFTKYSFIHSFIFVNFINFIKQTKIFLINKLTVKRTDYLDCLKFLREFNMRHHQSQPSLRMYKSVGKHSQVYINEEINKLKQKKQHIIKLISNLSNTRLETINKQKNIVNKKQHLTQLKHQLIKLSSKIVFNTKQIPQHTQQIATNMNKMSQIRNMIITNCEKLTKSYSKDYSEQKQVYLRILSLEEIIERQLNMVINDNSRLTFKQLVVRFCKYHHQQSLPPATAVNGQTAQWRKKRQQRIAQWQANWLYSTQSSITDHNLQQNNLSHNHSFQQVSQISQINESAIYQQQLSRDAEDWLQSLREHNSNIIQLNQRSTIVNYLNSTNPLLDYHHQHRYRLRLFSIIARQNLINQFQDYIKSQIKQYIHSIVNSSNDDEQQQQQSVNSLYKQIRLIVQSLQLLRVRYYKKESKNIEVQQLQISQSRYCQLLEMIVSMKVNYNKLLRQNSNFSNKIQLIQSEISQLTKQQRQLQAHITHFQQNLHNEQIQVRQSLQSIENSERVFRQDIQQIELAITYLIKRFMDNSNQREYNRQIVQSNLYYQPLVADSQQQQLKKKDNITLRFRDRDHECICRSMSKQDLSRFMQFKSQSISNNINHYCCGGDKFTRVLKENVSNNISEKLNSINKSSSLLFLSNSNSNTLHLKSHSRTQSTLKLQSPKDNIFSQTSTNFQSPCNVDIKSIQSSLQNITLNQSIKRLSKAKAPPQLYKSSNASSSSLLIKSTNPKINNFFKKFDSQKNNQHLKLRLL